METQRRNEEPIDQKKENRNDKKMANDVITEKAMYLNCIVAP